MTVSNYALMMDTLRHYRTAMGSFVVRTLKEAYGNDWWESGVLRHFKEEELARLKEILKSKSRGTSAVSVHVKDMPDMLDIPHFRQIIQANWKGVFQPVLQDRHILERWIAEVTDVRNDVAHWSGDDVSRQDALRFVDTCKRIIQSFDREASQEIQRLWDAIDSGKPIEANAFEDETTTTKAYRSQLHDRLKRAESASSVPGSLPILFFGDIESAMVATIGLNPSRDEFLDGNGGELTGSKRRLHTLQSVDASDRRSLDPEACEKAILGMTEYFGPGRPVLEKYFGRLDRVLTGLGFSYRDGSAAHLDLVQEATTTGYVGLPSGEWRELLSANIPFLRWELEAFDLHAVFCNGRTVWNEVERLLGPSGVQESRTGSIRPDSSKMPPVNWYARVSRIGDRDIGFVGWDRPLGRAGLTREQDVEFGASLKLAFEELGLPLIDSQ